MRAIGLKAGGTGRAPRPGRMRTKTGWHLDLRTSHWASARVQTDGPVTTSTGIQCPSLLPAAELAEQTQSVCGCHPSANHPIPSLGIKSKIESEMKVTQSCLTLCKFSRPEYWSGQPLPSPGNHLNPGIKPRSPTLQADSLPAEPQRKPKF